MFYFPYFYKKWRNKKNLMQDDISNLKIPEERLLRNSPYQLSSRSHLTLRQRLSTYSRHNTKLGGRRCKPAAEVCPNQLILVFFTWTTANSTYLIHFKELKISFLWLNETLPNRTAHTLLHQHSWFRSVLSFTYLSLSCTYGMLNN
jgi:hypothetical protein